MPKDRGGGTWRRHQGLPPSREGSEAVSIIPSLFFPQSSSPPHTQADLTSILHIFTPGVVMLRESLTWALSLVMAMSLRGEKSERKD